MSPSVPEPPFSTLKNSLTSSFTLLLCCRNSNPCFHCFQTHCNSILHGTSSKVLNKLQYIENCSMPPQPHLILRPHLPLPSKSSLAPCPLFSSIQNPAPYKPLNHLTDPYLTYLLHCHSPDCSLCSSIANLLSPLSRTKHPTWGNRAFSMAAPPFGIHSQRIKSVFEHLCKACKKMYYYLCVASLKM